MSHDMELEELRAGVSCAVLLERHPPPWQLDKRESTRNCLKYRRGAGEILLVTHEGRGWWDPGSTAKGDVFSLVQHLEPGLNLGQVRKVLRPLAGLSPTFPEHLRARRTATPAVPVQARWDRKRVPVRGSATWRYLTVDRHLPEAVLRLASQTGVLREGPHGSAWFAHHDHGGRLTGIEMRGPAFRGFSPGSDKTLFRLAMGPEPIRRLVVLEAPIDAMSLAVLERLPVDTLYVTTAGGMGPETIKALELQLAALAAVPGSMVVAATDADTAGDRYALCLQQMSAATGVGFERLRPSVDGADWNDVLKQRRGT